MNARIRVQNITSTKYPYIARGIDKKAMTRNSRDYVYGISQYKVFSIKSYFKVTNLRGI